jgi:hypothetical protein
VEALDALDALVGVGSISPPLNPEPISTTSSSSSSAAAAATAFLLLPAGVVAVDEAVAELGRAPVAVVDEAAVGSKAIEAARLVGVNLRGLLGGDK